MNNTELIKQLRELASIPAYCGADANCEECSKISICLSFTNKRIIETATEAANAIEELQKKVRATEWDETCDPEWRDCNELPS